MQMTFQQYIDNPLGKRNAAFSQRDMYRALYTDKFDKLLLREAGKINFTMHVDKTSDRYIFHAKIPSETVKNFYYDAVILFYTDDAGVHSSPDLKRYYVKFYSNDPAFVFTYLKVFLDNDLFFEDLKSKASAKALKKDPVEKNPYKIPGYSKILYFAYLFMNSKNYFNKYFWDSYGKPYKKRDLVNAVEHSDKKIADRQRLTEEQAAKARAEAKRAQRDANNAARADRMASGTSSNGNAATKFAKNATKAKVTKRAPTAKRK